MAKTVSQLEPALGSYVEPGGQFIDALSQVLPRLYNLGLWRDLVFEISTPGTRGYVSLPADAEAVLACAINDSPRQTRSMWHDIRIVGRQPELSNLFGIVDDGMHPTSVDVADIDEENVTTIHAVPTGDVRGSWEDTIDAVILVTTNYSDRPGMQRVALEHDGVDFVGSAAEPFTEILEINYSDLPQAVDLLLGDTSDEPVATLPAGSGIARFRRFRISEAGDDTVVHLLCKRAAPSDLTPETVIHLSNVNALKHALLGRVAEDNSDVQRAQYHWELCNKLLDEELDAHRGSCRPALQLDLWGANKPLGML